MNLGFFEEANISTTKGSADNKLNMNVEVKEKATGSLIVWRGFQFARREYWGRVRSSRRISWGWG